MLARGRFSSFVLGRFLHSLQFLIISALPALLKWSKLLRRELLWALIEYQVSEPCLYTQEAESSPLLRVFNFVL